MKLIKPVLYYFIILISLYCSKIEMQPAHELWFFLFNNYNETNLVLFLGINLFYLGWIILYNSSKSLIFKLLKISFNKLKLLKLSKILYNICLYLNHLYYYIFKFYRKITIHLLYYFMINIKIYYNLRIYYFFYNFGTGIHWYFPDKLINKAEALFYYRFLKKNYTIPIKVEINNKKYIFALGEILGLLNEKNNSFQKIYYSKEFKHLILFINFFKAYYNIYLNIENFNWNFHRNRMYKRYNVQLIPFFLKYYVTYKNYKQAKLFLTLFKCDQKLIRDFYYLNLFRIYNRIKKKKLFIKIDIVNPTIIYKKEYNTRYEYPLVYLKLLRYNYFPMFLKIFNFNLIYEVKTVYSIIKYSIIYKILSFFILSKLLQIIILFILIFNLIQNWSYLKNYKGFHLYYYNYKIFQHKLIRIILYNLAYIFNLFTFNFNFLYFYLLNYLVMSIILIILMSFYDFFKSFRCINSIWCNDTITSLFIMLCKYYLIENYENFKTHFIYVKSNKVIMKLKKKLKVILKYEKN